MSANVGRGTPQLYLVPAHQVDARVGALRQHHVERDVDVAVLERREQVPLRRVGRRVHQHAGAGVRREREVAAAVHRGAAGDAPVGRRRPERTEVRQRDRLRRQQAGARIGRLRRVRGRHLRASGLERRRREEHGEREKKWSSH
jgi:hypothetical protein